MGGVSAPRQSLPPAQEIAGTLQGLLETHGHSAARVRTVGNGRIHVLWRHPAKWAALNVTLSLTRPQAMALVQFLLVPLPAEGADLDAWESGDGERIVVWGTHDPQTARQAYDALLTELGMGADERPAPNFETAAEYWAHPAARDVEDDVWPKSFVSEVQRDGWVPFLIAAWEW